MRMSFRWIVLRCVLHLPLTTVHVGALPSPSACRYLQEGCVCQFLLRIIKRENSYGFPALFGTLRILFLRNGQGWNPIPVLTKELSSLHVSLFLIYKSLPVKGSIDDDAVFFLSNSDGIVVAGFFSTLELPFTQEVEGSCFNGLLWHIGQTWAILWNLSCAVWVSLEKATLCGCAHLFPFLHDKGDKVGIHWYALAESDSRNESQRKM